MMVSGTVQHSSAQSGKRELAGPHRFLVGYCNAVPGMNLAQDGITPLHSKQECLPFVSTPDAYV
jgi:hypothetical protein